VAVDDAVFFCVCVMRMLIVQIEMMLVTSDPASRRTRVCLRAGEVLHALTRDEEAGVSPLPHLWRPEYARFSLESTPGRPYAGESRAYALVEANMIARRRWVALGMVF
jgi:glutamate--cysteine ligase catalytic subunit